MSAASGTCPICGQRRALDTIDEHVNNCLDIAQSQKEKEQKQEQLELEDWTILEESSQSNIIEYKQPPSQLKIFTKKILTKLQLHPEPAKPSETKNNESLEDELSEFSLIGETNYAANFWVGETEFGDYQKFNEVLLYENYLEERKLLLTKWDTKNFPAARRESITKYKFLIRKGIPNEYRRILWQAIIGVKEFQQEKPNYIRNLYSQVFRDEKPDRIFTVPTFSGNFQIENHFLTAAGCSAMHRIFCIIATIHTQIDFCPVICNLVPIFLLYLNEEESLLVIDLLIELSLKYRHVFLALNAKDYKLSCVIFDELLKKYLPTLYQHMVTLSVTSEDFSKKWFEEFFVSLFPYPTVLRIVDCFISEGNKVLFRTALAILDLASVFLMEAASKEQFINCLQSVGSQFFQHSKLMEKAFSYSLGRKLMNQIIEEHSFSVLGVMEPPFQVYYRPKFAASEIISSEQFEILYSWLPDRFKIKDPTLLFTTSVNGYSLNTLVFKSYSHYPSILLIKASDGYVFGAFVTTEWKKNEVFGSHEMFLFSLYPTPQAFEARPDLNQTYINIKNDQLQIGQGNYGPGICLDDNLYAGSSYDSATFRNGTLSSSTDFTASVVELWGFY